MLKHLLISTIFVVVTTSSRKRMMYVTPDVYVPKQIKDINIIRQYIIDSLNKRNVERLQQQQLLQKLLKQQILKAYANGVPQSATIIYYKNKSPLEYYSPQPYRKIYNDHTKKQRRTDEGHIYSNHDEQDRIISLILKNDDGSFANLLNKLKNKKSFFQSYVSDSSSSESVLSSELISTSKKSSSVDNSSSYTSNSGNISVSGTSASSSSSASFSSSSESNSRSESSSKFDSRSVTINSSSYEYSEDDNELSTHKLDQNESTLSSEYSDYSSESSLISSDESYKKSVKKQ